MSATESFALTRVNRGIGEVEDAEPSSSFLRSVVDLGFIVPCLCDAPRARSFKVHRQE